MPTPPDQAGRAAPAAPSTGATRPLVDLRTALVDRSRALWLRRLVDRSRNNNLLFFRDLKAGTLDLTGADPAALAHFLDGASVRVDRLLPGSAAGASARARTIAQRARSNQEEKAIDTLFVALGLATWTIADGGRPPAAPIVLIPATLELLSRDGPILALERSGEAQINGVLLDELEQLFRLRVDPDVLLEDDVESETDLETVFERLRGDTSDVPGFGVDRRIVLGNFSYLKLAIVQDLRSCGDLMAQHPVIAAIAGADEAIAALRSDRRQIALEQLDTIPPGDEFAILDADSSQLRAIVSVLGGQHGVIQGPPGTGKSQTIANLIASLVARGKRVLFVAEKRAALEVVLRRLERAGLGHLALDLHGADIRRSAIVRHIALNLDQVRTTAAVDADATHSRYVDRRDRLNAHVARLHRVRDPWGVSLYEIQGRLLRLPPEARLAERVRGEQLGRLDAAAVARVTTLLADLAALSGLFYGSDTSPWLHAALNSGQDAQHASALVAQLGQELAALQATLDDVSREVGLPLPRTLAAADELCWLLHQTGQLLEAYGEQVFDLDSAALARQTAAGRGNAVQAALAFVSNGGYRAALAQINATRRAQPGTFRSATTLAREIEHVAHIGALWQRVVPGIRPRTFAQTAVLRAQLRACGATIERLRPFRVLDETLSPSLLAERCSMLESEGRSAFRVARVNEVRNELTALDLGPLMERLRRSAVPVELWPRCLEHVWLSSILDRLLAEDTALAAFSGAAQSQTVLEFDASDRRRLEIAAARVRRAHAEAVIAAMNRYPDEADLVRREAAKKKRHLPLRTLLARAPHVLTAVCPCWMASPLSLSQLVDARQAHFDVVVFDEASQVLPEDAVAAILRGRQVVVAGDRFQLPPTRFFVAGDDEDAEADALTPAEGFESLLDLLGAQLDPWSLDWHYRSRDESLIAFSNRHIYNDRLITFPGAGAAGQAISHLLVPWRPELEGRSESSSAEVERVVELILEHAASRPGESLGVIAMGITHAQRIEVALDLALRGRPDLEPFFSLTGDEPFFIKNLERVQGDEREAIILSIGYAKDAGGKLPYHFGPLLTEGGERRLNVAITRARDRLTLVSSFTHLDMDPARSQSRGVALLRAYLEYAAGGGRRLSAGGGPSVPLSAFEADVFEALSARGVPLVPQWGVSSYRLDFAARHPERPEQLVLAIECDGDTYRSAPTARDRDRLRRQQLEALGWRFHRIWSTDWFEQREQEIERAVQAYQQAVAGAGVPHEGQAPLDATRAAEVPIAPQAAERHREPRPPVSPGREITQYSMRELLSLIAWIQSDGLLRTDAEIAAEMLRELGFKRRGSRIDEVLGRAIAVAKTL